MLHLTTTDMMRDTSVTFFVMALKCVGVRRFELYYPLPCFQYFPCAFYLLASLSQRYHIPSNAFICVLAMYMLLIRSCSNNNLFFLSFA
ncbi:hypothetical protein CY34DRAFT_666545 [Suillus luteus UH-Slu-Lm8-n1]|uniref:Uncharacterized protein n=1 Tax=Suillus luteus UH-Slu-Lm8-n1 TaxID=930992 RepID=A0A0D0BF41_9AGAM|nr:hypothetical protein CY34DRAFT_666545 [Suillus luteus UH-Slu-Lm8-n1]